MTILTTFLQLAKLEEDCDHVQTLIDAARETFKHDQYMQIQLDIKQLDLDDKRLLIEITRRTIAHSN
jgi:hypothetical protein